MTGIEERAVHRTESIDPPLHCFTIWPHRSLGAAGRAALLGVIALALAYIALRSPPAAFWPMVVGCGLTFGAIWLALTSNVRAARMSEQVEIGPKVVRVHRLDPRGRRRTVEFSTHWVRVVVSHDRAISNRVTLAESGRSISLGEFLSPAERSSLADAIRASLAAARS